MLRKHRDVLLLAGRLIVGGIFITAGWMKLSDMAGTVFEFSKMGFSPFWAYLVSYVEFIGGICVVLGLYIETAAALLSVVMIVAIYKGRTFGFQGFMPPLALLGSLLILLSEAGRFAVGSNLHKKRHTGQ
jgi:putative oxidoreductase